MPAIAVIVEGLQLSENLIGGFGAWHATIQLNNIAELAGEWAATRILHANEEIMVELDQIVAWHGAYRDVDLEFFGDELAFALAAFPSGDKFLHDFLGLADHLEVCIRVKMRARGDVRPTDAYWLAVQVNEIDQVEKVRLLVEHTADHHEIGPVEVRIRQRLSIAVDETNIPVLRQHGGHRDKPQWRRRVFRADEFASFRIVPERLRNELRVDH